MRLVLVESPFAGANNVHVGSGRHPHNPVLYSAEAQAGLHSGFGEWGSEHEAIALAKRGLSEMYARAAMHDCFMRGEAPFASHLLYTQDGVLDDDVPEQREMGIEAGLLWGRHASKTVVYIDLGISDGMKKGIDRAKGEGRPIEQRRLPGWS